MKFIHRATLLATLGMLPCFGQVLTFKHIIVIVQENRTPDNLFYGLCSPPYGTASSCSTKPSATQYNIKTKNWLNKTSKNGLTQPTAAPLASLYGPDHDHKSFVSMCDAPTSTPTTCAMDGAAGVVMVCASTCPPNGQFVYVDNSEGIVNPYLDLATQYGFADYMFQTNQGPSFPSHQFLFGGTSAPSSSDDAQGIFAAENNSLTHINSGCISPANNTVQLITPQGELKGDTMYPCYEHQTLPDLLAGYTWRYYDPSAKSLWTAPNAIAHICQSTGPGGTCAGPEFTENVNLKPAGVLSDIGDCALPNLSWVIPSAANSDHAAPVSGTDGGGPSWVASIVNAVGASTKCDGNDGYWKDTAVVVTWDDWGGWYDHEAPTFLPGVQGDYQYGFRVPMLFISAYTPARYINKSRLDFGSILRFVEKNFGIKEGALEFADARANNDLSGFYNLKAAPRSFTTIASPKNAEFFLNDTRPPGPPDDDDDAK